MPLLGLGERFQVGLLALPGPIISAWLQRKLANL